MAAAAKALPFCGGEHCYACDARPVGLRDRRPEGGELEVACARHADPKIKTYAACYLCHGPRPSRVVDYDFVHKGCIDDEARC